MDTHKFEQIVSGLENEFLRGRTRNVDFRLAQLKSLLRLYEENNDLILESLHRDMRKSNLEGYLYEVDLMKNDVRGAINQVASWSKRQYIPRNLLTISDRAFYIHEPLGVVLIIGTWNYPFQLTLVPMCGAIAAGNCVIIKPSEISSASAQTMAKLIPKYLDPKCYVVVQGDGEVTKELLKCKFDHIFYTGSYGIGKQIHLAANKNLTPVTLEMGGKSPVFIDNTVNYKMTAKRLMWGKCMNMGQTCVAPDYVLCSKEVEREIIYESKLVMEGWYGKNWKVARDLARIVNMKHWKRLIRLLQDGKVAMGGNFDESEFWIEPTVITDVKENDEIMQEEIFGPILAFMTVNSEEEAIAFINKRPKPLCCYVFSDKIDTQLRFQNQTRAGTMAFNDTIIQFAIDELPFGGVGESGMGSYHGKFSFDTFSNRKSIVERDFSILGDFVGGFRYPPYTNVKINFLSFLLCHWKKFKIEPGYFRVLGFFLLGFFTAILLNYILY